ncbi:hypothetical protein [Streptomyces sp. XD-27]|uniref:hypothetical protein n=1 Tax=Streptomyces sp. XD-27 TaxID=3062779 RepID=UPI0026F44569|nr:hypothetical protein [Streptomyces sp. XD-27]WKX73374.1 hypothetical protein Q3Y56_28855 [Streptomyces sp. XD-27]
MTTEPEHAVTAAELAELRGNVDVGLTRVDGRLALLDHRAETAEDDVAQLAARVRALEHARWPLPSIAALTGLGGLALTVWQVVGR